jgi:hypothetical protein
MFPTLKIIGLSAVLSAGIVTAYELPQARDAAPSPKHADRILPTLAEPGSKTAAYHAAVSQDVAREGTDGARKGDLLRARIADGCTGQAWPNISPECVMSASGTTARKPVRTITIEERQGPNTSALVRLPLTDVAARR